MTFPIRVPASFALALLAGCASRSAPASYPANAALSPQAPEAPLAPVTVALDREPPLPGESNTGWPGLGDPPHSTPQTHNHAAMGHGAPHDHAAMGHGPAPHDHAAMGHGPAQPNDAAAAPAAGQAPAPHDHAAAGHAPGAPTPAQHDHAAMGHDHTAPSGAPAGHEGGADGAR